MFGQCKMDLVIWTLKDTSTYTVVEFASGIASYYRG